MVYLNKFEDSTWQPLLFSSQPILDFVEHWYTMYIVQINVDCTAYALFYILQSKTYCTLNFVHPIMQLGTSEAFGMVLEQWLAQFPVLFHAQTVTTAAEAAKTAYGASERKKKKNIKSKYVRKVATLIHIND